VIIQAAAYSGGHKLGWRTPNEKHLAKCLKAKAGASILSGVTPVKSTNLFRQVLEVLNQGALGSCTAQAATQALRMRLVEEGHPTRPLASRLLAYFLARYSEGEQAYDVGSQICTVFEMMARHGWVPEKYWPYDIERFAEMPDTQAMMESHDQRGAIGINYYAIEETGQGRIDMIRKALTAGFAVTWGAPVTDEFCSTTPLDVVHRPGANAVIAGGHAQLFIGHVDAGEYFLNLGSWGEEEARDPICQPGVCRIGYDYAQWYAARDFYIVAKAPEGSAT
jgi:hypothetical protein